MFVGVLAPVWPVGTTCGSLAALALLPVLLLASTEGLRELLGVGQRRDSACRRFAFFCFFGFDFRDRDEGNKRKHARLQSDGGQGEARGRMAPALVPSTLVATAR